MCYIAIFRAHAAGGQRPIRNVQQSHEVPEESQDTAQPLGLGVSWEGCKECFQRLPSSLLDTPDQLPISVAAHAQQNLQQVEVPAATHTILN